MGPRPYIPFPSRPHIVCKFCSRGDNLSVLRLGPLSITVLVFPDFADAYSRTTTSCRLTQLSGQIPESSQFLGASKLPLLEWPSLNAGTTMHTTQFCIPPNLCLCNKYLSRTNFEIVQNSKLEPKKFSFFCTFKDNSPLLPYCTFLAVFDFLLWKTD